MQIPETLLDGKRLVLADGSRMHRHGTYERFASPTGDVKIKVQRYLFPSTRKTASVLPKDSIPYRPISAGKLETYFNLQSEQPDGSEAKPTSGSNEVEAGVLDRAWNRFTQRLDPLRKAFDQLLTANLTCPKAVWKELILAKHSLIRILGLLFEKHSTSLLKDYRCSQGGDLLKNIS
jgi:hypothetical protein